MKSLLKQSWLVLVLAAATGISLAAVEKSLEGRIDANKKRKLERAAMEVVGADAAQAKAETWDGLPGQTILRVRSKADGRLVGWAVLATTEKGYSGHLELMIGLDGPAEKITGLQILFSQETPGLGDRIRKPDWRIGQFRDKPADTAACPLKVVKSGQKAPNPVDAVSGATISSKAVVQAVNDSLARVHKAIAKAAGDAGPPGQP